jgi:hypothetical protein
MFTYRVNFLELRKAEVQLPRITIPRTRVNKGKKKGRDRQEPRLFQLARSLSLSVCVPRLAPLVYDNLTGCDLRWVRHQGS